MNTSSVRSKLSQGVSRVTTIVGRNLDLPVLSCVLVSTGSDQLILQTTDIEHAVTVTVPAKIESEGTVAVPASVFGQLLSGGRGDSVSLVMDDKNLRVKTDQTNALINILPHEEFPAIPHIENDEQTKRFDMPVNQLLEGLRSVSFAASQSNIKPELSSVYVYYEAGVITFVCTDGYRLAEKKYSQDYGGDEFSFLLPVKSANALAKVFDTGDSQVTVFVTDNQIALQNDDTYFTCRLVNGSFPDYKRLIPDEVETSAVVLKSDLVEVLKLSNIFSNEFHEVIVNVDPEKNIFELNSSNQNVGNNSTKVQAALEGEALTVTFNHRYLNECLPIISTDSIEVGFNASTGQKKPIRVTTVPNKQFTYIVMPLDK